MRKIKNIAQLMAKYNSYGITRDELRTLLKSEPFGRVTGIIGPFVLRYHKNKLIISDRAVVIMLHFPGNLLRTGIILLQA